MSDPDECTSSCRLLRCECGKSTVADGGVFDTRPTSAEIVAEREVAGETRSRSADR